MIKNAILTMIFFSISVVTFCQQNEPAPKLTKQDYLQKSKSQKTGGFIFLGVAATCAAIAAPGNVSFDVLPVLVVGGGIGVIGSVLSFMSSAKNKRKANSMSASFKMEPVPVLSKQTFLYHSAPSITLKISL
ncbi:MAG: hypothetical protein IPH34_08080 [Chitinophagaceae bacterium]|nr:hypothetical protein [Chitinophagaceae bacterium]MBK8311841.1 hypothetical protein [Chitinophagaceae bacterium]MBK8608015.1 hypothetical protein [Chitinophagaceae bacterium]MBP6476208.1 hypothetical protein [Chitinophagaceae bacterium]MBP7108031.1 hypothetical protein [Chitinophagaceae bacterium]